MDLRCAEIKEAGEKIHLRKETRRPGFGHSKYQISSKCPNGGILISFGYMV